MVGTSPRVSFLIHLPDMCMYTSESEIIGSNVRPPHIMVALFQVTATWPTLLWGSDNSDLWILYGAAIGVSNENFRIYAKSCCLILGIYSVNCCLEEKENTKPAVDI